MVNLLKDFALLGFWFWLALAAWLPIYYISAGAVEAARKRLNETDKEGGLEETEIERLRQAIERGQRTIAQEKPRSGHKPNMPW